MSGSGSCRHQHDRHSDDRVLDARDMQAEIDEARNGEAEVAKPREFSDVANQWLQVCLEQNAVAAELDIRAIAIVMRLGTLGTRLIYEANAIGMRDIAKGVING